MKPLLLIFLSLVASQTQCPVCFDCERSGCLNFGTCAGVTCACHAGFGDSDCSKTTCGSIASLAASRTLKALDPCTCSDGATGPNCNVCTQDSTCALMSGVPIGTDSVCNKSPVVWASNHHSVCAITSIYRLNQTNSSLVFFLDQFSSLLNVTW